MDDRNYSRWSVTGAYCFKTNADCDHCRIFLLFGKHKNGEDLQKCHQPAANENLLSQRKKCSQLILKKADEIEMSNRLKI